MDFLFLILLAGAFVAIGFCVGVVYALVVLPERDDPLRRIRRDVDTVFDEASERARRISDYG